jgi:hypothetical protein
MKRRITSSCVGSGVNSSSGQKNKIDTVKIYLDAYKLFPQENPYFSAFCTVSDWEEDITRVLYPGSYIHIIPSLVFKSVTYVDIFKGKGDHVAKFFSEESRSDLFKNLIAEHQYTPEAGSEIRFYAEDFTKNNALKSEPNESFDMLVCLSASGFIPESCFRFVRAGGLLFVNDDFGDACLAKAMPEHWTFVGAIMNSVDNHTSCRLVTDADELKNEGFFSSKKKPHAEFTNEQLLQNKGMSFSKRIFKGKCRAFVYLFRKKYDSPILGSS